MKFFLFLVIMLVFSAFLVNADNLSFEFVQSNYFKGDTLQVWINASEDVQEEIKHTDLGLLKEGSEIIVYPYLVKLINDYYFAYYKLPFEAGQYSFLVKDLLYLDNGVLKSEDFISDFSIIDDVSLNFNPGIFKVANTDSDYIFQLFVKNNKDSVINVEFSKSKPYTFLGSNGFSLNSGQTKVLEIFFDHIYVNNIENDVITVSTDGRTYEIPIWLGFEEQIVDPTPEINDTNVTLPGNETVPEDNETEVTDAIQFVNQYSYLNETLGYGERTEGSLFFRNYINRTINDVSFIFTGNLNQIAKLDTYLFESVAPGEVNKTFLSINREGGAQPGEYTGSVRLLYEGKVVDFPVNIVIENQEIVENEGEVEDGFVEQEITEDPLNGNFYTNDTLPPDDQEPSGKTWIWVFLGILLVIAVTLFIIFKKKIKKSKTTFFGQ